MNAMLNALVHENNFTYTENGALTHKTTGSKLYDLFAMGGAYRNRSNDDIETLFMDAYMENPVYALKCLFYLRNVRGGQGERRFFRVAIRKLAEVDKNAVVRNISNIVIFGRFDDLFALEGTPAWNDAMTSIRAYFAMDMNGNHPTLLGKWLPSENASSKETKRLAGIIRRGLGLTHRQYRKALTSLRSKINIVEKMMSEGKWDDIKYDGLPSKAGINYRNAFLRHDHDRYVEFMSDRKSKVNAGTLAPYEVVEKAIGAFLKPVGAERDAINKYWDNLTDYFKDASLNALCMIDTSGSMWGRPMNVAISLGMYCAERCNGPFKDHYISFASRPQLIKISGHDFVDKVNRIYRTNLCDNTNISEAFGMLLNTAKRYHVKQSDLPKSIIVISDMEFDHGTTGGYGRSHSSRLTLMEGIRKNWERNGYEMPNLVYWNVDARQNNISENANDGITYVSGFSPVIFKTILTGKTGYELMMDTLNAPMYESVR